MTSCNNRHRPLAEGAREDGSCGLDEFRMYAERVEKYNHNLTKRFSGIFTFLLAVLAVTTADFSSSEFSNLELLKEIPSSLLISLPQIAAILLLLLMLHELRIFIQYQTDVYSMVFCAFELCRDSDDERGILHVTKVAQGVRNTTMLIYMVVANALVFAAFGLSFKHGLGSSDLVRAAIGIVPLVFYLLGIAATFVQYLRLARGGSSELYCFARRKGLVYPGMKFYPKVHLCRSVMGSLLTRLLAIAVALRVPKKIRVDASENCSERLELSAGMQKGYRRLNRFQRRSFAMCVRKRSVDKRQSDGIRLPKAVFIDVTSLCNLSCLGCYANDLMFGCESGNVSKEKLSRLITTLESNGVTSVVLTGGEPFMHPDLLCIVADHPKVLFFVFTNCREFGHRGQGKVDLGDENVLKVLREQGNLIPVLSLDGPVQCTDGRRGKGTYGDVIWACERLAKAKIGFGVFTTVGQYNYEEVSKEDFPCAIVKSNAAFHVYMDYVGSSDDCNVLEPEQKNEVSKSIKKKRQEADFLVARLPQDEGLFEYDSNDKHRGCVAGKHIFHIRLDGTVSSCPYLRSGCTKVKQPYDRITASQLAAQVETLREGQQKCGNWSG